MLEIVEHGNINLWNNLFVLPPKYNKMWGCEYMLMDSNNFMGGTDGTEYDAVIDMLVNIRNVNNPQ